MGVGCNFYVDLLPEQDGPTMVRLGWSLADRHSDDHRRSVNCQLSEKLMLKAPDLRPANDFQHPTITRLPKNQMSQGRDG